MAKHGQTVFYLERLQLDWLPNRLRWVILLCNELVVWLISGLFGVLVFELFGVLVFGLAWMFGEAMMFRETILSSILNSALVGALIGFLCFGIPEKLGEPISCVETVRWSWQGLLSNTLVFGLVVGLIFGLLVGLAEGLRVGLRVGLVCGLVFGPVGGLVRGLTFSEIETRTLPNEGIRRSARNAFFVTMFGVLIVVLIGVLRGVGLVGVRAGGLHVELGIVVFGGLVLGLVGGLQVGGAACLKHLVLRLWLIRNGSTPWNYVRFLDYASERILLRKVGGGYAFIHRMLLEYFAARYVEPSSGDALPAKPSSISDELQTA
jgi:hypothetical protein